VVVLSRRSLRSFAVALVVGLGGASLAGCAWFEDDDAAPGGGADPAAGPPAAEVAPTGEPRSLVFPGDGWATATPSDAGLDPDVIDELADDARRVDSDCFVVVRDGLLVEERSWRGGEEIGADEGEATQTDVFSVTKSIASTLVGLAQADGLLDIDEPAARYVPEWVGSDSKDVTIRQLLSNASGRRRALSSDYLALAGAEDRTAYAVGVGQAAPPGSVWAYNNTAIQVLDAVLVAATGRPTAEFAEEQLFDPLGMGDTDLPRDRAGGTTLAFGATTTCLDLARLGMLVLGDGRWDGEQLLPEGWVEEATTPSTELNEAYGLLWWLNVEGRVASTALATSVEGEDEDEVFTGQQVPGAPDDLVWALGLGDQILQIHPSSGTIAVRIGRPQALDEPDRFSEADTARLVTEGLTS
jgi:CubicO group peptidase (beta-lactamase class C family)